jgi:pteridine reductase
MELRDRVALVTGAGRRIGRAIAIALADRGMHIAVHYNQSADGAEETRELITRAGGRAAVFHADLSLAPSAASLASAVSQQLGAIDALVNSAAVMERTPFGTVSAEEWDAIFAINLRAPFLLTQAAAPQLSRAIGGGAVVNIADLAAFETWPAYVPHSITKAGVVQMTRALARVMAPQVRVNAVAPGAVLLPDDWTADQGARLASTTPLRRLGTPDDVVHAVLYLLEADYVTGETLIVDGGRHVRT